MCYHSELYGWLTLSRWPTAHCSAAIQNVESRIMLVDQATLFTKAPLIFCRRASASQTSSMQRGELLGNNNIYADILSLCGEASGDHSGKILEAMVLQCSRAGADNWQNCINSVSNNSSDYLSLPHPNDMHLARLHKGLACYWTIRLQHQDCYLVSKCCITGTKQRAVATHQEEAYLRVWGIKLQKLRYVSITAP